MVQTASMLSILTVLQKRYARWMARWRAKSATNFKLRLAMLLGFGVMITMVGAALYRWSNPEEDWSSSLFTVYAVSWGAIVDLVVPSAQLAVLASAGLIGPALKACCTAPGRWWLGLQVMQSNNSSNTTKQHSISQYPSSGSCKMHTVLAPARSVPYRLACAHSKTQVQVGLEVRHRCPTFNHEL